MPVTDAASRVSYPGNNSTVTEYVIPFYFFDADHIAVNVLPDGGDEVTLDPSDYAVLGEGDESGGTLTTDPAIPASSTITIYRQVPLSQQTELPQAGRLSVESIQEGLDLLTMIAQQLERALKSSLRVSESSPFIDPVTVPDGTISKLFVVGELGQPALWGKTELLALLNLTASSIGIGIKVFTEATKATAVPDYIGQVGISYDAASVGDRFYIAHGTSAGNWTKFVPPALSITTGMLADLAVTSAKLDSGVKVTATWADNAARAALAPSFAGQLGLQIDSGVLYRATGTSAGNWSLPGAWISGLSAATAAGAQELLLQDGADWKKLSLANLATFIGSKRLVNYSIAELTADFSTTSAIPFDASTPQSGEGAEVLTVTHTPLHASNILLVEFHASLVHSSTASSDSVIFALFRDSGADAITAGSCGVTVSFAGHCNMSKSLAAGSTSATTFKVRVGTTASATAYVNRISGTANLLNAAPHAALRVFEFTP